MYKYICFWTDILNNYFRHGRHATALLYPQLQTTNQTMSHHTIRCPFFFFIFFNLYIRVGIHWYMSCEILINEIDKFTLSIFSLALISLAIRECMLSSTVQSIKRWALKYATNFLLFLIKTFFAWRAAYI